MSPSLVSTIMQYLANTRPGGGGASALGSGPVAAAKRITETESGEGLINFAPLGERSPCLGSWCVCTFSVVLPIIPHHRCLFFTFGVCLNL